MRQAEVAHGIHGHGVEDCGRSVSMRLVILGVLVAEQLHARELREQVVERALALGER